MEDQHKLCNKCGVEKPFEEFPSDKSKKDGKRGECKECYRNYAKNARVARKVDTKKPIASDVEKFRLDVKNFAENFDKVEHLDEDFLKSFQEKAKKFYHEAKFPPTNIFKASVSYFSKNNLAVEATAIIQSKLSLFLFQKKKLSNINIVVKKSETYTRDNTLLVELPEEVKLSDGEIEEFFNSSVGVEKITSVDFSSEKDISREIFYIVDTTKKIISESLKQEIKYNDITIIIIDRNYITLKWAEQFAISSSARDLIKSETSARLN
jgi:hypothetical protein